jgi:hypothetical protein
MVTLRIYDMTAKKILRKSVHANRRAARASLSRYERKHGRRPNAIDSVETAKQKTRE